jgi:cell division protein FtsN
MKILSILLIMIVLLSAGCKTQKIAPKPEPIKSESVKSESAKSESSPVKSYGNAGGVTTSSVKSKEERVSAAKGEDNDLGSKRFYIIMGSFGVYENAQKFKKQLAAEGFFPGILVNEAGLYRVCVNSYDDEEAARGKLGEIRKNFTKYSDAWLLIKKQ